MSEGFLKRYTELPFLLHLLRTKMLTLLSPESWDEKNDSHYLLAYRDQKGLGSVLALCFTLASETYHHWKVFSGSNGGVCINFNRGQFGEWLRSVEQLKGEEVRYVKLDEARDVKPEPDKFPFLKRHAFRDEEEYRLIYETGEPGLSAKDIDLDLTAISAVVLSPWLSKSVSNSVKETIRNIDGCGDMRVFRTTLVNNEEWKRYGNARG